MFTTGFIITILAALYLAFIALLMKTNGIGNTLLFKMLPLVLGFLLGLQAFKVI